MGRVVTGRMAGSTALVIGAGLIGSEVVAGLQAAQAVVACADLDANRAASVAKRAGCGWYQLDLAEWDEVERVLRETRPDVVVHAAGRLRADDREQQRRLVTDAARDAFTLASACAAVDVPVLVLASSLGVYGTPEATGQVPFAVPETAVPAPVTGYGAAKLAAEAAVLGACAGSRTTSLIARLSGVFGGHPRAGGGRLNAALFRLLVDHLAGRPVQVTGSFGGREYLYVADAAEGLLRIAEFGMDNGHRVFNIGTGILLNAADVAAAFTALGSSAQAEQDPTRPSWRLEVGRAREYLGFSASTTLTDGLRRWIDWLREEEA